MMRQQVDLKVTRSMSLFFALSWLVIHEIDEKSPLFQLTLEQIKEQNIEVGVSVIGHDSTFSQTVHANCVYESSDIIFDQYFVDVIQSSNGKVHSIDYRKFHDLRRL